MDIDVALVVFSSRSQPVDSLEQRLVAQVKVGEGEDQRCAEFTGRDVERSSRRTRSASGVVGFLGAETRLLFGGGCKSVARYFVPMVGSDR